MANQFYMEQERMTFLAKRFESDAQTIRNVLSKLGNKVEELRSGWKGEAASSFFREYEIAEEKMMGVFNEVHEMGNKIQRAAQIIAEKDNEGAVGMHSISDM